MEVVIPLLELQHVVIFAYAFNQGKSFKNVRVRPFGRVFLREIKGKPLEVQTKLNTFPCDMWLISNRKITLIHITA
ncbi:MAG: hypothetical protein AABY14_01630 [Nanoarchaeota archaeon]